MCQHSLNRTRPVRTGEHRRRILFCCSLGCLAVKAIPVSCPNMEDCCAVCAEPLTWLAYAPCGHRDACSKCVARLRFVMKDKRCVICQQQSPAVVVTRNLGNFTSVLSPADFQQLQVGVTARLQDLAVDNQWLIASRREFLRAPAIEITPTAWICCTGKSRGGRATLFALCRRLLRRRGPPG